MNATVFIATTGKGLSRAERLHDEWRVEALLAGEPVRCLALDPADKQVIYAGTQNNGIFRSNDAGKTWSHNGLAGLAVKSIAISPVDSNVLYAGTKPPALYVSHDGGQNWQELESLRHMRRWFWNTPAEPGPPYVQGLTVSPTDPNIIIAGIEYGATLRSADGGQTWQGHLKGAIRDCHSLTFHGTDGQWVYEGGGGWPAAISRDAGVTWQQPRKGMGWSLYGWAVAADPERPDIWYVTTSPFLKFPRFYLFPRMHMDGYANTSIFRSTEGGRWERLRGGLPQPLDYAVYALLTDPDAPGHLYAGLSNGDVWHSSDYGDNWQKLPFNLSAINRALVMI